MSKSTILSSTLKQTKKFFPLSGSSEFRKNIKNIKKFIDKSIASPDQARIGGEYGKDEYQILTEKYSILPEEVTTDLDNLLREITQDLFSGVPRWRSPNLLYNVGAAVNVAASSMYSVALDENIYNINDGLAGNALVAEMAVTNILAKLARLDTTPYGVFTFGGTGTNLYAIKIGTRKAQPNSGKEGVAGNIKVMVTEDAHFSHAVSVDWLGIGTNNIETIKLNADRTSNLEDAEKKARQILESRFYLSTIIINGGTTYSHTIDDIDSFVSLRDKLVTEYKLTYKPHIHVDSVIGWAWLMFSGYDFDRNKLGISTPVVEKIKRQYNKIKNVRLADSWGIDFHKGVGACPVSCSMIIANDYRDVSFLSKKVDQKQSMHQLAEEFCFYSPADYTLETSRAGGASLAALTSLMSMGQRGYQVNLSNLIDGANLLRKYASMYDDFEVVNKDSDGYVVMIRLHPPGYTTNTSLGDSDSAKLDEVEAINRYNKEFFNWDLVNRIKMGKGVEYSFSSNYNKLITGQSVSALKLYPVSPHFNKKYAFETISTIKSQKEKFDKLKSSENE